MKQATAEAVKGYVLQLLPQASAVVCNHEVGVVIVAHDHASRAITPHMPNEEQAWLRAAEQLGWR